MYRIFISHASAELGEANALVRRGRMLANGIFLGAHIIRTGPLGIDALKQAIKDCERRRLRDIEELADVLQNLNGTGSRLTQSGAGAWP